MSGSEEPGRRADAAAARVLMELDDLGERHPEEACVIAYALTAGLAARLGYYEEVCRAIGFEGALDIKGFTLGMAD